MPPELQWTQTAAYGVLSFACAALIYRCPETNNSPLKETVSEYIQAINERKLHKYKNKINNIMSTNVCIWSGLIV